MSFTTADPAVRRIMAMLRWLGNLFFKHMLLRSKQEAEQKKEQDNE